MTDHSATPPVSRRRLLTGGAIAVGGALTGGAAVAATTTGGQRSPAVAAPVPDGGTAVEAFHGPRQAGVATHPQAHASFVAFTLNRDVDRAALVRLMRLLTDDAARLTQGQPALADTERELAVLPARLTVTFGFGPGLYRAAGLDDRRPTSVANLPPFTIDRLEPSWSGGDLLIQICADDPLTVAHTQRMVVKDARPFGTVHWVQQGFRRGQGVQDDGTDRNATSSASSTAPPTPKAGTPAFDQAVWVTRRSALAAWRDHPGRTTHPRGTRDLGRSSAAPTRNSPWAGASTPAPHSPGTPNTTSRISALPTSSGSPSSPTSPTSALAHVTDDRLRILRRPYNYDERPERWRCLGQRSDFRLVPGRHRAPVPPDPAPPRRTADLFNEWTTPIGSAVFAIPPGCAPDGWIGEQLLG